MIEVLPESEGNVLGVRAIGMLSGQDYEEILIPRLATIMERGKARFLFEMGPGFLGWMLDAVWADAKFGLQRRNDFEKVAIVGATTWIELGARLGAWMMTGEVKTFPSEQRTEAWSWIKA